MRPKLALMLGSNQPRRILRAVCLGNLAGNHAGVKVPPGDLLICAGSMTANGFTAEIEDFGAWLRTLPHPRKIVVAGDLDHAARRDPERTRGLLDPALYLDQIGRAHV